MYLKIIFGQFKYKILISSLICLYNFKIYYFDNLKIYNAIKLEL